MSTIQIGKKAKSLSFSFILEAEAWRRRAETVQYYLN